MFQTFFAWTHRHERHLSALAMVAGFVADNLLFIRVDFTQTQVLLAGYATACFLSIPLLHLVESRADKKGVPPPRARIILTLIIQFALGGFWSAFVIFYGRSAVFGASWPFLLFLLLVFLGSEYFHQYHERLVFTSVLFFFALYSVAVFMLPIYTGTIGTLTFLASGAIAAGVFVVFTALLRFVARERFLDAIWKIRLGTLIVIVLMNTFYFTSILPPLPLSSVAAGVYHEVWHIPGAYYAKDETDQSWQVRYLGFPPTVHVVQNESLFAYSSVFAPTAVRTTVVHRWQWYDPAQKVWVKKAAVAYSIVGGRDGGYRGYSKVLMSDAGQWRVNIETTDGRLIEQLPFTVERVTAPAALETITLK